MPKTKTGLRTAASRVSHARLRAAKGQDDLVSTLGKIQYGDASLYAKRFGVSPQYLSDIRNGNRGVSDAVLERLVNLK